MAIEPRRALVLGQDFTPPHKHCFASRAWVVYGGYVVKISFIAIGAAREEPFAVGENMVDAICEGEGRTSSFDSSTYLQSLLT